MTRILVIVGVDCLAPLTNTHQGRGDVGRDIWSTLGSNQRACLCGSGTKDGADCCQRASQLVHIIIILLLPHVTDGETEALKSFGRAIHTAEPHSYHPPTTPLPPPYNPPTTPLPPSYQFFRKRMKNTELGVVPTSQSERMISFTRCTWNRAPRDGSLRSSDPCRRQQQRE